MQSSAHNGLRNDIRCFLAGWRYRIAIGRQSHRHARSVTRPALGPDRASVGFYQRPGDCQTQAEAAAPPGARAVPPVKALENMRQVLGGNAGPVITDLHFQAVRFATQFELDGRSFWTVADGI